METTSSEGDPTGVETGGVRDYVLSVTRPCPSSTDNVLYFRSETRTVLGEIGRVDGNVPGGVSGNLLVGNGLRGVETRRRPHPQLGGVTRESRSLPWDVVTSGDGTWGRRRIQPGDDVTEGETATRVRSGGGGIGTRVTQG